MDQLVPQAPLLPNPTYIRISEATHRFSKRVKEETETLVTMGTEHFFRNLQMQYLFHIIFGATDTQPFARKAFILITCQM